MKCLIIMLVTVFLIACNGPAFVTQSGPPSVTSQDYCLSSACRGCHDKIFDQHSLSHHEKSFTNQDFQAQYFKELLPLTSRNPDLMKVAAECTACHAPIAYATKKGIIGPEDSADPRICGGVTCDFCHSISGYTGKTPGNGNYVSTPCEERKLGPFKCDTNWHHTYSNLFTKSEFCGICHNQVNQLGLQIKSTYTEWQESSYAKAGIQCQDCHMNLSGYLTGYSAEYESGRAAYMTVGEAPQRERLYTHRFPGAHSKTQITAAGAITMSIEIEEITDHNMTVHVFVNNEKTGHKMPSGSSDLRILWLEVDAHVDDKTIFVPATRRTDRILHDIAGEGVFDKGILGGDIPKGSRVYRSIFVDAEGKQTLSSYNAVKIIFDNRLNASEIREEVYHANIPAGVSGKIVVEAHLKYLPYPSSFTRELGLEKPDPFEMTSARKVVMLK